MPGFLLDFLLVVDIMLSVTVLMVSIHLTKPVDFNVFPTALLILTLFRLALNVSSSRLILLNGNAGTSAAGDVIESFGNFVVGGNYIIGTVIFLILIAIQYVVINHGAGANFRGHRTIHARRAAGKADVDRFRSQRGTDR